MGPERSSAGGLHIGLVAGVSPVAVHRAALFLLNSTMMLFAVGDSGGNVVQHSATQEGCGLSRD